MDYQPRVVDALLEDLLSGLPAIAIEGAKGVGKTATAQQYAASTLNLDRAGVRSNVEADPEIILGMAPPTLIDEWQLAPPVWDVVRREVDRERIPGRFILTGSSAPASGARLHSGAGRIVRLHMRPMTLPERGVCTPSVSLSRILAGEAQPVAGHCEFSLRDYTREILWSGLPGVRQDPPGYRLRQIDSYLTNSVEHDIPELGVEVRRPAALRAWLTAYAAATSTTTNYTKILNAATPGDSDKLSRVTAGVYRELLERMMLLEPLPAWTPVFNPLSRLAQAPKHHLVDPALAARLLGATEDSLLTDQIDGGISREGTLLGALFESLVVMTVRVFGEQIGGRVSHLRTRNGDHEVDLIIERDDHRVVAIEVKLSNSVSPADTKHLSWLTESTDDLVVDRLIINTGQFAHRLPDGTAVIPLALLGP